jgi:AbiU2
MRSPFFDLLNSAYVSSTASALRRLVETQNRGKTNVSLRIMLDELGKHPNVLEKPLPVEQIQSDLARLDEVECKLKPYVDRVIAHLDRRGLARVPKLGDLKESVVIVGEVFRKYYGALEGSDLTLTVSYVNDFDIFAFPWAAERRTSLLRA